MLLNEKAKRRNYIYWLCDLVGVDRGKYDKMDILLSIEYEPEFGNDENRAIDGMALRRRYETQKGFNTLDISPCSQLEMMVALSERAEELMTDDENDRDAGFYFNIMWNNLKLNRVSTQRGIENAVLDYDLFVAKNPPKGWDEMEVWRKMNWVLTEMWYDEGENEW